MESKRDSFIQKTKESVRKALQDRDLLITEVQRSTDELTKVKNSIVERLEEWYAVYFPEIKIEDKDKFAEFVIAFDKKNTEKNNIAAIVGVQRANDIITIASQSLGADLADEDIAKFRQLAQTVITIEALIKDYEEYQQRLCEELCPNITAIAGSQIAAKLISHVGSLRRLALLPSSTIQVLGAEKALFKHLKNPRISPPKHGIIFQYVHISSSPKAIRGKIARALANHIAMAAKADAFTKNFIAEKLKDDFNKRFEEIIAHYKQKMKKKMEEP